MTGRLEMTGRVSERGDSAVAKSHIPGFGYRKATEIPKGVLHELAHGGRKAMRTYEKHKEAGHAADIRAAASGLRAFEERHPTYHSTKGVPRPRIVGHAAMDQAMGQGTAAFAFKTGGRRSPGKIYARPDANPVTIAHEHAHVTPKRSGYRLAMIQRNPRKQMAEEARADYMAGHHYQAKELPKEASDYLAAAHSERNRKLVQNYHRGQGDKASVRQYSRPAITAYRNVQNRMAYAGAKQSPFRKVDVTMSDKEAKHLAARYDTRGPLPKSLSREQRMKAYEARYVASGGRKAEKWKRRASGAELGRNIGLAGVTAASGAYMAARGHRTGSRIRSIPRIGRHLTPHKTEIAGAGAAVLGGSSELYGEYARHRRASYQNSPAGVAGSALSRMQAYTPEKKS